MDWEQCRHTAIAPRNARPLQNRPSTAPQFDYVNFLCEYFGRNTYCSSQSSINGIRCPRHARATVSYSIIPLHLCLFSKGNTRPSLICSPGSILLWLYLPNAALNQGPGWDFYDKANCKDLVFSPSPSTNTTHYDRRLLANWSIFLTACWILERFVQAICYRGSWIALKAS